MRSVLKGRNHLRFFAATGFTRPSVTPLTTTNTVASWESSRRSHGMAQAAMWSLLSTGVLATEVSYATMEATDEESEQDHEEFDYYVHSPTVNDLPVLLAKFEVDGLDVWPWVWVHGNENGPHHVFVGINDHVLKRLKDLRTASPQNNLLLIVSNEREVAEYSVLLNDSHCGVIVGSVELLHPGEKLLMLKDERIIAFDTLTIV